jgi:hypothetical protein
LHLIERSYLALLKILSCDLVVYDLRDVDASYEDDAVIMKFLEPSELRLKRVDEETADNMPLHNELTAVADKLTDLLGNIRKSFYISDGDRLMKILKDNRVSTAVDPSLHTEHPLVHEISAMVVSAVNQSGTTTPGERYIRGGPYY